MCVSLCVPECLVTLVQAEWLLRLSLLTPETGLSILAVSAPAVCHDVQKHVPTLSCWLSLKHRKLIQANLETGHAGGLKLRFRCQIPKLLLSDAVDLCIMGFVGSITVGLDTLAQHDADTHCHDNRTTLL